MIIYSAQKFQLSNVTMVTAAKVMKISKTLNLPQKTCCVNFIVVSLKFTKIVANWVFKSIELAAQKKVLIKWERFLTPMLARWCHLIHKLNTLFCDYSNSMQMTVLLQYRLFRFSDTFYRNCTITRVYSSTGQENRVNYFDTLKPEFLTGNAYIYTVYVIYITYM